jgi:hypothetical protein
MDDPQQPARAPVIRLRDKITGQVIIVANTHSPAFERYAEQRYLAGKAYRDKLASLRGEGLPMFFTGDFNSGYWIRSEGNTTWQNLRENLTYCQLTADGLMNDAFDVAQGLTGPDGAYCPRHEGSGENAVDHVYVSPGVEVSRAFVITGTLSDHNAYAAHVVVPGAGVANRPVDALGTYIGPKPGSGEISLLPVARSGFLGMLRLSLTPVVGDSGPWQNPLPVGSYTITDRYGWRTHPVTGVRGFHNGLDMADGSCTTPVSAASAGTVVKAAYDGAWGNLIVIKSGSVWIGYPHMNDTPTIQPGTAVSVGQVIGTVGATGLVTGCHLHLMVCTDLQLCLLGSGALGKGSVDPIPFFAAEGVDLEADAGP